MFRCMIGKVYVISISPPKHHPIMPSLERSYLGSERLSIDVKSEEEVLADGQC